MSMKEYQVKTGWKGFLSFRFVSFSDKTVVKDKKHFGPLVVQRPYYQEKDLPMVLILHPPGGIAGGDELQVEVNVANNAKGMVSTPAATKFYRSNQWLASQNQIIKLETDAELEWLPQETLFFDKSVAENNLKFDLQDDSVKLIAWDIVGLGRPESGEVYQEGELTQTLTLNVGGKCVLLDKLQLDRNSELLSQSPGFYSYSLYAMAIFYSNNQEMQQILLEDLQSQDWLTTVGVTKVSQELIVMRALSHSLDDIKADLYKAWCLARPLVLGRKALKPRIWNT